MTARTVLRVGIIPFADNETMHARVAGFCAALGEALGMPVELDRAPDYRSLVESLEDGDVSVAWVPPVVAARGVRSGTIRPAALAVRNGAAGYSTALITPSGSAIKKPADLRGARAAWVDDGSAGGYLVIRAALREAGVDFGSAFATEEFMHSHAAVARAVIDGQADVGATYFNFHPGTTEIARAGWKDVPRAVGNVRILAHAGPIPSDFLAVHHAVEQQIYQRLQLALIDGHPPRVLALAKQLFGADAFAEPTNEHMAMLRGLLASVEMPPESQARTPSGPPPAAQCDFDF